MKIYTKRGDGGETSLFNGKKVRKSDTRVEAYGTIDELNSYIGTISSFELPEKDKAILQKINQMLFITGTDLATPIGSNLPKNFERVSEEQIKFLENAIDDYSSQLPELKNFILPGGCFESGFIHIARTVCRRAERKVVELEENEPINHNLVVFLNRLSDFLFVFARYYNKLKGIEDLIWKNT